MDQRMYPTEGYGDEIGTLVRMLELARFETIREIEGLTVAELDFLLTEKSNSIGALLQHMAAIEHIHQILTFEKRDPSEEELEEFRPALFLGEAGRSEVKGNELHTYLEHLRAGRDRTLTYLKTVEREWLYEESTWPDGTQINHYFLWYHVLEDEISHRGQIRLIKAQLS
ncbi:DinB family protein [Shouchella miscanthi]|uniref:DinB family protein n=1 Tax=Shouchella miscanthi TaxID=2598861 RepID=UPI001FEC79C6|nr:DinB family protein [Shouchella miscanthi]